jgi:hypothetical protein
MTTSTLTADQTALDRLQADGVSFETMRSAMTHVIGTYAAIADEVRDLFRTATADDVRRLRGGEVDLWCPRPARALATASHGPWNVVVIISRDLTGELIASIWHYGPAV